jgi:chromosomal replication initiation ATPase DnaA
MQQLILPLDLPTSFHSKDFIVSSANEEAYMWVKSWPNWPTPYLVIYGDAGCGKTHLSHLWQEKTKAWRLKPREFKALSLSDLLEAPPFFILEDAHLLEKGEKLFHLYNHLLTAKGGLLLLSRTPPAQWKIKLPDLESRLKALSTVKINPPDEILLGYVIQKLFSDLQVRVEGTVVAFLLSHIERSFESAKMWVNLLNKEATAQKRAITVPLAREILKEREEAGKDPQFPPSAKPNLSISQTGNENQQELPGESPHSENQE